MRSMHLCIKCIHCFNQFDASNAVHRLYACVQCIQSIHIRCKCVQCICASINSMRSMHLMHAYWMQMHPHGIIPKETNGGASKMHIAGYLANTGDLWSADELNLSRTIPASRIWRQIIGSLVWKKWMHGWIHNVILDGIMISIALIRDSRINAIRSNG